MKKTFLFCLSFALFFIPLGEVSAQDSTLIKLHRADVSEYDASYAKAQRLIGNVMFEHQGAIMECDSAWLYEETNIMKAFGNVRITQGDSIFLNADRLIYKGDSNLAELFEDIKLRDKDMTLTTEYLKYDTHTKIATYFNGGKIVSSENNNVLTSKQGSYLAESKSLHFKDSILLVNPEYTMETDTLQYGMESEQAFFYGPTTIKSKNDVIYCENGWYDTKNDLAQFNKHAYLWSAGQQLLGDSLYYDRNMGLGEAFGNVTVRDTINDFSIKGEYGKYLELEDRSYVTGRALYQQFLETDTLHLHADTLYSEPDTLQRKIILAYPNVKFYKNDMQGACDSLSFSETDSLLEMFVDPVIWADDNQITGEKIEIKSFDGKLHSLACRRKAFMASKIDSTHFNQIKGKNLFGFFKNNELYKVDINGNGESVYYATDDADGSFIGVNKSTCSDITVYIKDRAVARVKFKIQPNSAFYPLDQISKSELILKDFRWEESRRPKSAEDIFVPTPKANNSTSAPANEDSTP